MKTELDFTQHHLARQWPNVVVETPYGFGVLYSNAAVPVMMEVFMFAEEAVYHCNDLNRQYWELEQARCQARLAILQAQQSSDPSYEEPVSWPRRLGRVVSRLLRRK